MKKIIAAFLSAVLSMSLMTYCYAETVPETDCRDCVGIFDPDEFAEVISDTKGDYFMQEADALSTGSGRSNLEVKAYKLYSAASDDFLKELCGGADIHELISVDYTWMIPGPGTVAQVNLNEDGKWETKGYGKASSLDDVFNDVIHYDEVNSEINTFLDNNDEELKDMICVHIPRYFANFVCVMFSSGTYLIPYAARPDFTGLTNGKLYPADEVRDTLLITMGDPADDPGDEYNMGGAGSVSEQPGQTIPLPVIIIPAAVIAAGIVMILVWDKFGKRKTK